MHIQPLANYCRSVGELETNQEKPDAANEVVKNNYKFLSSFHLALTL